MPLLIVPRRHTSRIFVTLPDFILGLFDVGGEVGCPLPSLCLLSAASA
jgi:hypothetical protein